MYTLPVNTDVSVSTGAVTPPEDDPSAVTVLRSEDADYFDVCRFNAKFSEGRKAIMYDCRGVWLDTNIGGWNCL